MYLEFHNITFKSFSPKNWNLGVKSKVYLGEVKVKSYLRCRIKHNIWVLIFKVRANSTNLLTEKFPDNLPDHFHLENQNKSIAEVAEAEEQLGFCCGLLEFIFHILCEISI